MRFIRRLVRFTLLFLLLFILLAGGRLVWQGYGIYKTVTEEVPIEDKVEDIRGKVHFTPLEELPSIYLDAVVAVEDKRFYKHKGISLLSTGRAFLTNLKEKELAEEAAPSPSSWPKTCISRRKRSFSERWRSCLWLWSWSAVIPRMKFWSCT